MITNKMSTAANLIGRLSVTIGTAKNFEKCDPYFKLIVDDLDAKSSKKKSCTEGTWNYELSVDLDGSQDNFELQLWDYDKWTSDDLQDTTGTIPLVTALANWNGQGPMWVNLNNGAKVQITVCLC
jgi:Ca2+-dependent lipid-binding protein